MMTQPQDDVWTARLSEYVDDELSPAEREQVESHLESCTRCQRALDELRLVVTQLREAMPAHAAEVPPSELWAQITSRLTPRPARFESAPRDFFSPWPARLIAAGLLVAFGLAGGVWFGRAQCTGAIPWASSQWAQITLSVLGFSDPPTTHAKRSNSQRPADSSAKQQTDSADSAKTSATDSSRSKAPR